MFSLYKTTLVILLLQMLRNCESWTDLDGQSAQDLRDSKRALMNSLGLKYMRRMAPAQADFLLRRYSAPKFMMGLFKEVNSNVHHHLNDSNGFYRMERKYLDESEVDTVISFFKYGMFRIFLIPYRCFIVLSIKYDCNQINDFSL